MHASNVFERDDRLDESDEDHEEINEEDEEHDEIDEGDNSGDDDDDKQLYSDDCAGLIELANGHVSHESMTKLSNVCKYVIRRDELIESIENTISITRKRIHDIRIDYLLGKLTKEEWTSEFMDCYEVVSLAHTRRFYLNAFANSICVVISRTLSDLHVHGGSVEQSVDSLLSTANEYRVHLNHLMGMTCARSDVQLMDADFQ